MKKSELREVYKSKRQQLTSNIQSKLDDLMLIQFQQLLIDIPALIMTYSPLHKWNEFDPRPITDYCYFKNPGQQLFYPVLSEVAQTSELICVVVDDNTIFETNKYGINEPVDGLDMFPSEIDLVIVPLLCADKKGYRVGYGKGYYDRFLKECRPDCLKIGFSYFDLEGQIDDTNRYDVKLDFCITPEKTYAF